MLRPTNTIVLRIQNCLNHCIINLSCDCLVQNCLNHCTINLFCDCRPVLDCYDVKKN